MSETQQLRKARASGADENKFFFALLIFMLLAALFWIISGSRTHKTSAHKLATGRTRLTRELSGKNQ
jgi:hypothetical protein